MICNGKKCGSKNAIGGKDRKEFVMRIWVLTIKYRVDYCSAKDCKELRVITSCDFGLCHPNIESDMMCVVIKIAI